jgi:hypothetical protein
MARGRALPPCFLDGSSNGQDAQQHSPSCQWRWAHRAGQHRAFASLRLRNTSSSAAPNMLPTGVRARDAPSSPLAFISPPAGAQGSPGGLGATALPAPPAPSRDRPALHCRAGRQQQQQQQLEDSSGSSMDDDQVLLETIAERTVHKPLRLARRQLLQGGRYELQDVLTQGRFSCLWLARDTGTGRPVVIKVRSAAQPPGCNTPTRCWAARAAAARGVLAGSSRPCRR